jgi:hypothetical protein
MRKAMRRPIETFQVWHRTDDVRSPFGFTHVADVTCGCDPEIAHRLTTHGEGRPWQHNAGVQMKVENPRSTANGDFFVSTQKGGTFAYQVAPNGYVMAFYGPGMARWLQETDRHHRDQGYGGLEAEPPPLTPTMPDNARRAQYQRHDPDRGQER